MKRFLLPILGILASCVLAMAVGSSASSPIPASQPVSGSHAANLKASLADFAGEGTEASPYLIQSKDDLIRLSQLSCTDNPADLPDYGGSLSSFAGTYFKMTADIEQKGKPKTGVNGNFRLEVCLSDDHQFCALQLFRFADFSYRPFYEPRFYEGTDVEYITKLF